jgi:hypothetical protein
MSVDMGPRRTLAVAHYMYALRAGMNGTYGSLPRSWELQGSVLPSDSAMAEWVTLWRHDGDESQESQHWAVAAWPVTRNIGLFRNFRVIQHARGAGTAEDGAVGTAARCRAARGARAGVIANEGGAVPNKVTYLGAYLVNILRFLKDSGPRAVTKIQFD